MMPRFQIGRTASALAHAKRPGVRRPSAAVEEDATLCANSVSTQSFSKNRFENMRCRLPFGAASLWLALCLVGILAASTSVTTAAPTNTVPTYAAELYNDPTNGLGSWIWAAEVFDNQTCQFWKSFEIPPSSLIRRARLCMTVDNEFTVFLDGRELGHGDEWHELFLFDLTPILSPGRHVLAVSAFNSYSFAGMLLGLQIDLENGRRLEIKSDQSWRVVPDGARGWKKMTRASDDWPAATIKAPFGGDPWWTTPLRVDIMPSLQPIKVSFWQTGWFQLLLLSVCLIATITSLWLVAKLALHRKEQWLLRRERARIARDIHDDLGSRVTQLVLHGEVALGELPASGELHSQLDLICHDARTVLSVLDEILWAVNPKRDELRDFSTYVCGYAEQFLSSTPIQCFLDVDMDAPPLELNLPLRRGLLMVIKEALNNAAKHSNATELRLQIRCEHGQLGVIIQDNGKGFDPATAGAKRSGLLNMSQRTSEFGGTCRVVSQPGKGCTIEILVPLKQSRWRFWAERKP